MSDVTFDMASGEMKVHQNTAEPWRVTLVDTGENTMTGGRLLRVKKYINGTFCFTYGDGVSNVPIDKLIAFHKSQNCQATVTAIQPPGRYGRLEIQGDRALSFHEKPIGDGSWVNGGFFVVEPEGLNYISGDNTVWEAEPLETLAGKNQLAVYKHAGFWHPMDTLRDKNHLENLWKNNQAPWKIWD